MDRKLVLTVVLAALAGGYLFWRYWCGGHPDLLVQEYQNTKFGYSFEYPTSWYLGDVGDLEEEANPVWVVSHPEDVQLMEGGLPHEVVVPVVVHNLEELTEIDPSMLKINTSWDWVNWRRSQWGESDRERLGSYQDEEITVDGKLAIRTTFEASSAEAGPWVVVVFLDANSKLIYQIEYVSRQSFYDGNLHHFEDLLASFRCF